MSRSREASLDWMKALGICLIVYGHVAAATIEYAVPPIYPKQLGVAFFVFVMGYSLARETRRPWETLFNRLFEMYLFGVILALVLSALRFNVDGRLALSNYLPFLLGANVLMPNFPANPTTWFVGTYLHLLLLWALVLRGVPIRLPVIVAALAGEVLVRSVLMQTAGLYIAYMLLPNWLTVFLLGIHIGQGAATSRTSSLVWSAALIALVIGWPLAANTLASHQDFPFRTFSLGLGRLDTVITSGCISFVYLAYTWLTFEVTRRLPDVAAVRMAARNTLIVFLVHMPLAFWLDDRLVGWDSYAARTAVKLLVCLFLLTIASEAIRTLVRPRDLRDRWMTRLGRRFPRLLSQPV